MTLEEMAAAIAACDESMLLAQLDPVLRKQVLTSFGNRMARLATLPPPPALPPGVRGPGWVIVSGDPINDELCRIHGVGPDCPRCDAARRGL